MNFPRMRSLSKLLCAVCTWTLFCLPAGAQNPGGPQSREHTIPPNQQRGSAQAGLGIQLRVAPVVLPPRDKDRDHDKNRDKDKDRDRAAVLYNLAPSPERFSITKETLALDGRDVQRTTVVMN